MSLARRSATRTLISTTLCARAAHPHRTRHHAITHHPSVWPTATDPTLPPRSELYPVAFNYGKTTEKWIGNWLAARTAAGTLKRESLYLATKCNPSMVGGAPDGEEPTPHGYDAATLERSCRASIERMQCGYIDLYQLHWCAALSRVPWGLHTRFRH